MSNKILIACASGSAKEPALVFSERASDVENITVARRRTMEIRSDETISTEGYVSGSYSVFGHTAVKTRTVLEELCSVSKKKNGKPVLLFATGRGDQFSAPTSIDKVKIIFYPGWKKDGIAVESMPEISRKMGKKLAEAVEK